MLGNKSIKVVKKTMKFNYMLILGNSRTGKTTLAKRIVMDLKAQGFKVYVFDPNRGWGDLCDVEVGPDDLGYGLTKIGKPLLFEGKRGVLVVEDLGFTLQQLRKALNVGLRSAKNLLRIILENACKYGLKVLFVAHRIASDEVDSVMFQQFDAYALFNTPLTRHSARLVSEKLGVLRNTVKDLEQFNYVLWNGGSTSYFNVEALSSHMRLEEDRNFQVKQMLSKYETNAEKVLILKVHLGLKHRRIMGILDLSYDQVKSYVSTLRKRGVEIADGRRKRYENLLF